LEQREGVLKPAWFTEVAERTQSDPETPLANSADIHKARPQLPYQASATRGILERTRNRGILMLEQTNRSPAPTLGVSLEGIIPPMFSFLVEGPALLPGESPSAYRNLVTRLTLTAPAQEVTDWIELRHVADLLWDVLRWRRLRDQYTRILHQRALEAFLKEHKEPRGMNPKVVPAARDKLIAGWARGERRAQGRVGSILSHYGLTHSELMAAGYLRQLDDVERIEDLIVRAETRSMRALRDLERLKTPYARRLAPAAYGIANPFEEDRPDLTERLKRHPDEIDVVQNARHPTHADGKNQGQEAAP